MCCLNSAFAVAEITCHFLFAGAGAIRTGDLGFAGAGAGLTGFVMCFLTGTFACRALCFDSFVSQASRAWGAIFLTGAAAIGTVYRYIAATGAHIASFGNRFGSFTLTIRAAGINLFVAMTHGAVLLYGFITVTFRAGFILIFHITGTVAIAAFDFAATVTNGAVNLYVAVAGAGLTGFVMCFLTGTFACRALCFDSFVSQASRAWGAIFLTGAAAIGTVYRYIAAAGTHIAGFGNRFGSFALTIRAGGLHLSVFTIVTSYKAATQANRALLCDCLSRQYHGKRK